MVSTGATVEEYGSFVSNLFTKWGDLDISIQLENGLYISDTGKRRKVTLLGDLQKALRQKGEFFVALSKERLSCYHASCFHSN